MHNFGEISYATGEQAFEGSSAPAVGIQPTSHALPGDPPSSAVAPLSSESSARPSTATTSLTAVTAHDLQKPAQASNDIDYDMDSENNFPESILSHNLPQPARSIMSWSAASTSATSLTSASTSRSQTTPPTSSHLGPVRPPPNVRSGPYSRRSMSSRSNSNQSKASGKLSEATMITMVGNDIRYAVDQLQTSAVTAFAKPIHVGTIIQQNEDGFPDSIVLAAMSFFSEAENTEKANMYAAALPQYRVTYLLQELRRAGIPVDQMLADAANEPADQA